jgi:hypothetical protein
MKSLRLLIVTLSLPLAGCPPEEEEPLTHAEARQALEESALAAQAEALTSSTVEISTNFAIGQAVEAAAEELRDFIASQLPCAEIVVSRGTLEVEYGARGGDCTHHGQTYSGRHTITVERNDQGDVLVNHVWEELANQRLSVSGSADVTWSRAEGTRDVKHELTWTRLSDGRQGTGSGDRTQRALAGGILEGIQIDGSRAWEGEHGRWDLAIDGVQIRWVDPVPQAGSYTLVTPFDKSAILAFERQDADTIRVTVSSGERERSFDVTQTGSVEQSQS